MVPHSQNWPLCEGVGFRGYDVTISATAQRASDSLGACKLDETVFEDTVRRAFSHRRKTIRNPLKSLLTAGDIARAGVDPGARADTLGLAEFAALANAIAQHRPAPPAQPAGRLTESDAS